ncbi:sporulation protein [Catellatospora tritici]|uniref:sporulation protein n=1 Tax=Catellatospora tritici TaxID=2851566 RepID=UPI001C2DBC66|nr:sporulation protein [Catellatospora tritici]MBV1850823.1 sporulation protein [Catellatospora tritici]MBV1851076.1 sporulation protein [Catellatospora tritici]
MVFKKLLAGLGFGGVEVDTVLSPQSVVAGGVLAGQVNLRAKSDTDITGITLLLVASSAGGEAELARFQVAGSLRVPSGEVRSLPFSVPVASTVPFTLLYGQVLPGVGVGVRTQVSVAAGSAKGDFDPVRVDASPVQQHVMDALGTIGCRFVRNELRPGAFQGLPVPFAQAVTFYAPVPEGQPAGPHIPQLTFTFSAVDATVLVLAELTSRPGAADRHHLSSAEVERLTADGGWVAEVDRWVTTALERLSQPGQAAPGAFLQQPPLPQQPYGRQPGYGQPGYGRPGYAYGGHGYGGYKYGGYHGRPSVAGAVAAGVGGAALGFLGGMVIGDMISDAFTPDVSDASGFDDPGAADFADYGSGAADADYAGFDGGGFDDFGGGDFGGGDF